MVQGADFVTSIHSPNASYAPPCLSKSAIGPITLDFYAAFTHVANLQAAGVDTELTMEDLRRLMTDALEGAFDLKHGNNYFNAVQRFINSAPEYRPMELVAAIVAAKLRPSTAAYYTIRTTAGKAMNLAELYRDTLFPTL